MSWFALLDKEIRTNGYDTVSIAEALDIGLDKKYYTVVPNVCKRETRLSVGYVPARYNKKNMKTSEATEDPSKSAEVKDSVVSVSKQNGVVIYEVEGKSYLKCEQKLIVEDGYRAFAAANYTWVTDFAAKLNLEKERIDLLWAILYLQLLNGLIDADEDAEVIYLNDDSKIVNITDEQFQAISEAANKNMPSAKLLASAAVLNHYKLNHTVGQRGMQGFVKKVSKICDVLGKPQSNDQVTVNAFEKSLCDFLYVALHRIAKRNGAFSLVTGSPSLFGAFRSHQTAPSTFKKDEFVSLRATGAPAGAGKIPVLCAVAKMMASTGLIAFSPAISELKDLKVLKARVDEDPILCHSGARWYCKFRPDQKFEEWNQNTEAVKKLTDVSSIFLRHIAPRSTLTSSPLFDGAYESAKAMYAGFDGICAGYAEAQNKSVAGDKIKTLIKTKTSAANVRVIDDALTILADDTQKAKHADSEKEIINQCKLLIDGL